MWAGQNQTGLFNFISLLPANNEGTGQTAYHGSRRSSFYIWAWARQYKQNDTCAQRRLKTVWASAVWSESYCAVWVANDLNFRQSDGALVRLGGCPGWSESSLYAQVILLFGAADHFVTKTASLFLITSSKLRTFEHCGLPLNFTFEWVHCNWLKYQMLSSAPHPLPPLPPQRK